MSISIVKKGADPAYMQIYKAIRGDIISGKLLPGEKLESKRSLSAELGVSVITVEHAYSLLADEGYTVSRERSGCFVASDPDKSPVAELSGPEESLRRERLTDAEESFPFSVLAKIMRRVLNEYGRQILIKVPGQGCPELRKAIAGYLERSRGIEASADNIIIGSGSEYLYGMIAQMLRDRGAFGLEDPSYEPVRRVYELNGCSCEALKMGANGILTRELERSRAAVLHVTPYSSYPSDVTADASKRREYAAWAEKRRAYIVEDDYDSELSAAARRIDTVFSLAPDRVIYLNTFTKTIAPSMRMGYMLLPDGLMEIYTERLGFYSCSVPAYEQYVLAEFINSGELERLIKKRRREQHRN